MRVLGRYSCRFHGLEAVSLCRTPLTLPTQGSRQIVSYSVCTLSASDGHGSGMLTQSLQPKESAPCQHGARLAAHCQQISDPCAGPSIQCTDWLMPRHLLLGRQYLLTLSISLQLAPGVCIMGVRGHNTCLTWTDTVIAPPRQPRGRGRCKAPCLASVLRYEQILRLRCAKLHPGSVLAAGARLVHAA